MIEISEAVVYSNDPGVWGEFWESTGIYLWGVIFDQLSSEPYAYQSVVVTNLSQRPCDDINLELNLASK